GGALTPISPPQERQRTLSSLTSTLADELGQRQRKAAAINSASGAESSPADSRDGWSLGDLLARASREDESGLRHQQSPPAPAPLSIDVDLLSRALDQATASAIWSRFRAGQRGIMVRSIYSNEGRAAFDEV